MLFEDFTVPITGLEGVSSALLMFLIGIGLSIVTAYVFPRVFTPLFLKIKKKIFYRYEDAFVLKTSIILTPKRFLIRGI